VYKYKWIITDLQTNYGNSLHTLEAAHNNESSAEAINEAFYHLTRCWPECNIFSLKLTKQDN
jgi:hypothetical protein